MWPLVSAYWSGKKGDKATLCFLTNLSPKLLPQQRDAASPSLAAAACMHLPDGFPRLILPTHQPFPTAVAPSMLPPRCGAQGNSKLKSLVGEAAVMHHTAETLI